MSHRLFVAVWPPDEVLDAVAALPRPDVAGVRWTTRDQWHVTLRFLGSVPEIDPVTSALAGVAASPTTAVLGPAIERFGRRVLHVPVAGLDDVAVAVIHATRAVGKPPEDRPFRGHLTLARAPKGGTDLRSLCGVAIEGRWPVDDVCLVESRLSRHGARYEVVKRFPLV